MTSKTYFRKFPVTAADPCHCGGLRDIWTEQPYPGHNCATLYECQSCKSVVSLADMCADLRVDLYLAVPE